MVDTVLERLVSRGVEAVAIDEPNFIALFLAFGTYRVRIAVPDEQVEEARRVLAEWDHEARPEVRRLTRQVHRQFVVAGVVAAFVAVVLFLAGMVWFAAPAFLVVWFTLVVLLGISQRARTSEGENPGEDVE